MISVSLERVKACRMVRYVSPLQLYRTSRQTAPFDTHQRAVMLLFQRPQLLHVLHSKQRTELLPVPSVASLLPEQSRITG